MGPLAFAEKSFGGIDPPELEQRFLFQEIKKIFERVMMAFRQVKSMEFDDVS